MQKPSSPLSSTTSWFSVVVFVPQKLYFATKQLGSRRFPRFPSFNKPPDHHNHHHDHDHHYHDDHTQNTSPLSTEQHHNDVYVHFDDHCSTTDQPALVPAAEPQGGVVGPTSGPSTLPHDKSSPASFQPENGFSNVPSFASAIEILPITTSQDQFIIPCPNVQPNKPNRRSLKSKPNFKKKHPSFKLRISPRFLIPHYISKNPNINSRVSSVSPQKKIVLNNPIIEMFREEQLGRNVMVLAIPIATGLMAYYNPGGFASLAGRVAAVALSLGTAAIWNGILLRRTWPSWAANASELFGAALVLLAFFGYLGSRLPQEYIWLPLLCLVVCVVPLGMALCACGDQINGGEDYDHHHDNVVVNVDHIV